MNLTENQVKLILVAILLFNVRALMIWEQGGWLVVLITIAFLAYHIHRD